MSVPTSAEARAREWALFNYFKPCLHSDGGVPRGVQSNCGQCGFLAGAAAERLLAFGDAAKMVCQFCERGVCKHDGVDEFCPASAIHRELARLRGGK